MGKDLNGKELGVGLTQRKDGRYEAKYTDRFGKRKSIYGKKLTDVKRKLSEIRYDLEHGIYSSDPRLTVNDWFRHWMDTYKKGKVKESTQSAYEYTFAHISESIGGMLLSDVKTVHLQKIINDLEENNYAFSTMTLTRVTMHALFEQAVIDDYIVKNPSCGVKLPQDTSGERRVLTVDEQVLFLKYSMGTFYDYAFQFVLLTGLRSGECGGLKWKDIDFTNGILKVERTLDYSKKQNKYILTTPKTKSSIRSIPLCKEALEVLKKRKKEQLYQKIASQEWNSEECFCDLIFTTKNGKPCGHAAFNNALKSIITRINKDKALEAKLQNKEPELMKSFSMHTLRHTFATRAFESGMKPKIVQEILGHSTLNVTTDLYMHTTIDHLEEEMKKFRIIS